MFTKKNVLHFLGVVWILVSVGYIVVDQWQDFKVRELSVAYQNGRADAIRTIMTEVDKCKPLPLFSDEKEISVVSIECLQQTIEEEATEGE